MHTRDCKAAITVRQLERCRVGPPLFLVVHIWCCLLRLQCIMPDMWHGFQNCELFFVGLTGATGLTGLSSLLSTDQGCTYTKGLVHLWLP